MTGAKPVLADVELNSQNIDPKDIEKKINKNTKAILIVHFAGRACNMNKIMKIVKKHKLHLIEDCAHSIEGKYQNKSLGTFGTFGCFSFYATNLSIGEGGMLVTSNKNFMIELVYYHCMVWIRQPGTDMENKDIDIMMFQKLDINII